MTREPQRNTPETGSELPTMQMRMAFAAAWQAGQRPSISEFLGDLADASRTTALRELVALDIEYRRQAGETATATNYVAQFPDDRELIESLFSGTQSLVGQAPPETQVQPPARETVDPNRPIDVTQTAARDEDRSDQLGPVQRTFPSEDAAKPIVPLTKFSDALVESGLLSREEIATFLENLPADRRPQNGKQLAQELFRAKRLTRFQVQAVYQGKTRGLIIGNYVVLDKLGQGGMGQVYTARHTRMDRVVAIKVLPAAATKSPEAVKRFQREVKAAAKLIHPNIVKAYDADEHGGAHFLVMEYVAGSDLARLVQEKGPFSVRQAVDVIVQAARGLEYAHRQGLIHRDIKPQNLLLDLHGVTKILDMSLARLEDQIGSRDEGLTRSGAMLGTLDYMAPEQAMDAKTADARADIYSLGCTLHFLLTGKPPYSGDTVAAKLLAHRMHPVPSLREQRPDVPAVLDAFFRKMVAKKSAERHHTVTELLTDLQTLAKHDELDPSRVSHTHHATVVDDTAPVPTELLEEPDFDNLDGPAVKLTERQIVPAQPSGPSALRLHWSRKPRIRMAIGAAGVLGMVALWAFVASPGTHNGILVVEVDQRNAKVEILDAAGKTIATGESGDGPLEFSIGSGGHQVRIEKSGFLTLAKEIEIESEGTTSLKAQLERQPSEQGTILLKGVEAGLLVELLDVSNQLQTTYRTMGPELSLSAVAGTHRVRVERDGAQLFLQDVRVAANQTVELDVSAEVQARQQAPVALPATPPSAESDTALPSNSRPPATDTSWQLPASAPQPAIAPFDAAQARQSQLLWANYLRVPVEATNSIGMKLIVIPPGEFDMGSTQNNVDRLLAEAQGRNQPQWYIDRLPGEAPQHRVRISQPFVLGSHEVTVGQFRQFVADTGYGTEGEQELQGGPSLDGTEPKAKKQEWTWLQPGMAQGDNDPVVCVSWNDAAAYCEWLTRREGLTYRLPTEAEWEYACRAGSTTDSFFGSQESLDQYAWYGGNSQGHTHPVGEKNSNAWGLCDMYGNVWEWCGDWHADGYYNNSPLADPRGPTSGSSRVRRGGGWNYPDTFCRSALRFGGPPHARISGLGFRVAAVPFTR